MSWLSITYSFAAAALISGRIDAVFARFVRLDIDRLISLTLGIAMGFLLGLLYAWLGRLLVWDPVRECLADAMARSHRAFACTAVMEKREALKI